MLLAYSTRWAFAPNDEVLFLLSCWTHMRDHPFERVFHCFNLDAGTSSVSQVFPIPEVDFGKVDPEAFRGRRVIHMHPEKWIPIT